MTTGSSIYDTTLELPADQPRTLTACFGSTGAGADKYWTGTTTGGDGIRWDLNANWSPAGVPTIGDRVFITNGAPRVYSTASARAITISDAALTVQGGTELNHVSITVADDLSLLAGAVMTVAAGRGSNPTNHAAIYAEANPVTVGGTMRIAAGGVFTPIADVLTGVPVFVTAGNFVLEEGGKVAADGQGYGWELAVGTLPPGAIRDNDGYTFTPGRGVSYDRGAAYGANNSSGSGKAYGYAYAPWLPGSPSGLYNKYASYPTGRYHYSGWAHGGGAARIHATGRMSLAGWIDCNGHYRFYGGPSGGGIWLTAPAFMIYRTAKLTAEGGHTASNYGNGSAGTGGRISLGAGLTDEQISSLATGRPPASLSLVYGSPTFITTSVVGGFSPGLTLINGESRARQNAGTSTYTLNTNAAVMLDVAAVGVEGASAINGHAILRTGEPASLDVETFKLAADARSHFIASAWTVTNALGSVVAGGTGGTATFTPAPGATRLWLTWTLSAIEDEVDFAIVGEGTATTNGAAASCGTWRLARGTAVQLAAAPGAGAAFGMWHTDVPGTHAFASPWTFTVTRPCALTAHFDAAESKTYAGADGGAWEAAANWSPAGVPGIADAVSIGAATVMATSEVFAASLTLAAGGTLVIGGGTANVLAQVPTNGTAFGLNIAGNAAISGNLSIGGKGVKVPVRAAVGGNLALDGNARFVIHATAATDFDFATLRDEATRVVVQGAITLAGSSRIIPDADPVTGAPVRFQAGSVTVAEAAAFDADARGYGWTTYYGELPYFVRAFAGSSTIPSTKSCCYAPGGGGGDGQNDRGAGYGGLGDRGGWLAGRVYGYRYAPFLPGSCGREATAADRGGGTVWIDCAGQFSLLGTVHACGTNNASKSFTSSGGGIWINARAFTAGPVSGLSAAGGTTPGTYYGSGGGRICLVLAATETARAALATGATPDTLTYEDEFTVTAVDVTGGEGSLGAGTVNYRAGDGTASVVRGTATGTQVYITGSPIEAVSEGAIYGATVADIGQSVTFSASTYGANPTNAMFRYTCQGYIATNAAGVVRAQGTGTTATFVVQDEATYFTWLWGNRQFPHGIHIAADSGGSVRVGETTSTSSFSHWVSGATSFEAIATDEQHEFLYWVGDIPEGCERDNPITIPGDVPRNFQPVFRLKAAAGARAWLGGTGSWYDGAMWADGVIPGLDETAEIASGVCLISNYVECAAITVSGTAKILAGCYQTSVKTIVPSYPNQNVLAYSGTLIGKITIKLSGKLTMSGTSEFAIGADDQPYYPLLSAAAIELADAAKLMVVAGARTDSRTYATGSGFVNVAGSFTIRDTATYYPVSDSYSGGSVVCTADRFTTTTNATVCADDFGFKVFIFRTPQSLAPPAACVTGFGPGCGHGGKGSSGAATYDYLYAPVMPGATGVSVYENKPANDQPGGGVIRIHANRIDHAGALLASNSKYVGKYLAGAGGTIWITAAQNIKFHPGAQLRVKGGYTLYSSGKDGAGGGRISVCRGLKPEELSALTEDGNTLPAGRLANRPERYVLDRVAFTNMFEGVTVDIAGAVKAQPGTFVFLDGGARAQTLLILR